MASSTPSTVATSVSTSSSAAASTSPSFAFQPVAEMFTCGQTNVRWTYVGSSAPLTLNITNINVSQQAPLPTPSSPPLSTASTTASTGGALQLKRQFNGFGGSYLPPINVILIAGTDPSANNWTWPSVYVPQGWYQIHAVVQNTVQSTSSSFFVQNGTNTNCVVQYAATDTSSTAAHSSSTSNVPSSSSVAAAHSGHSNVGAIAGGVIGGIAFLAAAFIAFLYWYLRRRSSRSEFHDEDSPSRQWSELAFRKSRPNNSTRSSAQKAPPALEVDQTIIGSDEEISTVGHEKAIAVAQPTFQPSPNQPIRTQSLRNSTQTNGSYGRNPESPGARASYGSRPGEAIQLERTNTTGGSVTVPRRKPAPRYDGAAEAEVRRDGRSSSQSTLEFAHGNLTHGSPDSIHVLQHKSSFGAVRPMHVMTADPPARAA